MGRALGVVVSLVATACQPHAERATAQIGPDGGQLSSLDGVLTVVLHPGALSEVVEVQIEASDAPPPSQGTAYRVRPDLELQNPVEIVYQAAERLGEEAAVAAIRQEDYRAGMGDWVALPRLQFSAAHGLVAGTDTSLSLFYALVDGEPPSDETGTSGTGGSSTGGTGTSTGDGSSTTGFPMLSHAADIQPIWDANCLGAGCHGPLDDGGSAIAGVRLHDDAYPNIVDVLPANGATVPYVTPNDPDASYLLHKLNGTHIDGCDCNGVGGSMPLGTPLLPEETRAMVRVWIEQGALP